MNRQLVSAVTLVVNRYRKTDDDILAPVRQKLLDEHRAELGKIPTELNATFEKHGGWGGAISGATIGATHGVHIGIATGGTAFAATVPLAIIGGVIGYFGGAKAGSKIEKDK